MNASLALTMLLLSASGLPAQVHLAPAQGTQVGPSFDVVSMKLQAPSSANMAPVECRGGPGTDSPTLWVCTNAPLASLVAQAWSEIRFFQMSGVPSFDDTRYRYAVTAKLAPGTSVDDFHLMIRRLLRDRLGLLAHQGQKEQSVTELAIAKGGLKMKRAEPAPPGAEPPPPRPVQVFMESSSFAPGVTVDKDGVPHVPPGFPRLVYTAKRMEVFAGRMQSIADILKLLQGQMPGIIVDKTGLTGKYDFTLTFDLATIGPPSGTTQAGATSPEPSGPTIEEALVRQLGLQCRSGKGMVDYLVVDRFNRTPTEN